MALPKPSCLAACTTSSSRSCWSTPCRPSLPGRPGLRSKRSRPTSHIGMSRVAVTPRTQRQIMKRSRPCAGSFRFRPRSNLGELAGAYSWAIVGGITRHKIRDKHASASAKRSKRKPSYRRHSNRRSERPIRSSKIRSLLSVGIRALSCAEYALGT